MVTATNASVSDAVRVISNRPTHKARRARYLLWALWLLIVFNIALPKGGVMAGVLPITWGYVLLLLLGAVAAVDRVRIGSINASGFLNFIFGFLPISGLMLIKTQIYVVGPISVAMTLGLFFFVPLTVLVLTGPYLEEIPAEAILSALKWAVRFTVAWGVLNFLLYAVSKQFIEIPYLTTNGDDLGGVFDKNNKRGSLMKLVSTYNNGNIYGVCMAMLSPLYVLSERNKYFIVAFALAVLATLSRTVWFGGALAIALLVLFGQVKVRNANIWFMITLSIAAIAVFLPQMGWETDDVFDTDLGGRAETFTKLTWSAFGSASLQIPEMSYLGFFQSFGVVGGIVATAGLAAGPTYGFINWAMLSPVRKAATLGGTVYLACALIDGAFKLPPVLTIYLLVVAIIYRRGLLLSPSVRTQQNLRPGVLSRRSARASINALP